MVWVLKFPNLGRPAGHWISIIRLSELVPEHSCQVPWQPESPSAFHHSWLHACLLYLTLRGLVSQRTVSSRLFILLLPWFCGKTKPVIELSVVLSCFLICVWSYAWWDWPTQHKLAFTRLSPSMNKHFECVFI